MLFGKKSTDDPQSSSANKLTPLQRVEQSLWRAFRAAPPGVSKKDLAKLVAAQIRRDFTTNDTFEVTARNLADELGERAVALVSKEEAAIADLFKRVLEVPPEGRPRHLLMQEASQIIQNIETTLSRLQHRFKEGEPEFWALQIAASAARFAWHAVQGDLDILPKEFGKIKVAVEDCELDLEQFIALSEGKPRPRILRERLARDELDDQLR